MPNASRIAHADLPFANPMSEAAVDTAIALLPLPSQASTSSRSADYARRATGCANILRWCQSRLKRWLRRLSQTRRVSWGLSTMTVARSLALGAPISGQELVEQNEVWPSPREGARQLGRVEAGRYSEAALCQEGWP